MLSLEGRQLGNYDVIRRIRSGGMGAVYEGRQRTAFDRRVAIKVILGNYAEDPDMRRRFAREAKTIARLHHPHILPLIEFGDEQGMLYLVMPFIEGGTLTGYLRRHLPQVDEVSTIFLQMLEAVEYAHDERLIHRDIKSSNVLLENRRSGPPYAYLADFGLVRTIQQAELESSYAGTPIPLDQVPGTPQYMAPEQTRGIVTTSTDIYALGVLLFQMLTGELPYNDPDDIEVIKMHLHAPVPNPCKLDASIPAELGLVVSRAMAKRPEQRFPSVADFRTAFLAAVDGPVERVEDEEEFEVYELPPRPLLSPLPPTPLRPSQQLRQLPPQPGAIEFGARANPRKPRTTDDAPDVRRPRKTEEEPERPASAREAHTTGDSRDLAPPTHRLRTTGEPAEAALPQAGKHQPRLVRDTQEHSFASSGQISPVRQRMSVNLARSPIQSLQTPTRYLPPRKRQRRFSLTVLIGLVLVVFFVLLLLLPRSGVSIFPVGFPLFGASPVAKITLTVRTQPEQNTFLLTASPQTTRPDVSTRVMPDRIITSEDIGSQTVTTSGVQSTPGTQATGTIVFDNSGSHSASFSRNYAFTSSTGVQVRIENDVIIPARSNGIDGTANDTAIAVLTGAAGNLQAHAIQSVAFSGHVTISNPVAFSGGSDNVVNHTVTQSDLDGVKNALTPGLEQKVQSRLNSLLETDEIQAGTPVYNTATTSNPAVGAQAKQATVTVTMTATALVYNSRTARDLAQQLLQRQATQNLGATYQSRGNLNVANPTIQQQTTNGQLYLNVSASGLWSYTITSQIEEQWRQVIKGGTLTLAQNYLSTRPGITTARIQLPFNSTTLPGDETQIAFIIQ